MSTTRSRRSLATAFLIAFSVTSFAGAKEDFPPVTDAERALTAVDGHPGAPAVVLFENAELKMQDYPREPSSVLSVHVRLKILTEEGKERGQVSIAHSLFFRLDDFEGRTVRPDGTVVPLDKESVFQERTSRARKRFVTKATFPDVDVGSILEYRYKLRWDSLYFMEPWYFSRLDIPTLHSEITYIKPENMAVLPFGRAGSPDAIQSSTQKGSRGLEIRIWMDNPPPIADEPFRAAFEDLSPQFLLAPKEIWVSGQKVSYFDSWETVCEDLQRWYADFLKKDRRVKAQAKQLAATGSTRERAAALYAFVRDEIRTDSGWGIFVDPSTTADKVLEERIGHEAEKALLLTTMLEASKIESKLVWAKDREEGRPELSLANPWLFDSALVRLELDGKTVYLDPSDRRLAFGHLPPYLEGTRAMVHDRKKPEEIQLPERPFEENLRHAEVAYVLDEEGRLTGTGSLHLTGHHARARLRWRDDDEATLKAWKEWAEESFKGFEVSDVTVDEKLEDQEVKISWSLAQHEDEVLGDETSLEPSWPLGPVTQTFTLPVERRRTPVLLPFADRDEVTMTLQWPEGWVIDLMPEAVSLHSAVGAVEVSVEVDEAARSLKFHRLADVSSYDLRGRENYVLIRQLYAEMEKSDAQHLVLVRD